MLKSKKLLSMPIISLGEGQEIGHVGSLVVDPKIKSVVALVVEQRGFWKEERIIPYSKVSSIGSDAITIDEGARLERAVNLPQIFQLIKDQVTITGAKVLDEGGSILGHVDDYTIDTQTGQIHSLEISGNLVESLFKGKASLNADQIRTIGKEFIVVRQNAQEALTQLDGGLSETMRTVAETTNKVLESTSKMWESTLQKTKELGKNLSEKVRRDKGAAEAEKEREKGSEADLDQGSPESQKEEQPQDQVSPASQESPTPDPAPEGPAGAGETPDQSDNPSLKDPSEDDRNRPSDKNNGVA